MWLAGGKQMTAEVAILNHEAVAIAADSAVTVGTPNHKVYNTANKIFPLSTIEPIAVMVYGAGSFASIPWETVTKKHRRELAYTSYETVEEYAEALIGYLPSLVQHVSLHEQHEQIAWRAWWELDMVREKVESAKAAASSAGSPLTIDQIHAEVLNQINARISYFEQKGFIEGISATIAGREISAAIKDWPAFVDEHLTGLPTDSKIIRRTRIMVRASLRTAHESPWSSGVVVTGFGTKQLFPAMSHYVVDKVVGGKVRAWKVNSVCIGEDTSASICPFAQRDMIRTFMEGMHSDYPQVLKEFVDEAIELLIQHFSEQVKDSLSEAAHSDLYNEMKLAHTNITNHFENSLSDFLRTKHSDPIMSIVSLLPKEELADMAETLVSLTSFKRKVTPEAETVGGPIDVAVISKGDGLVWIKRKHYFSPELNPRYFSGKNINSHSGILGVQP